MLIPRFTLRLMLLVTTFSGFFFFIVAQAVRGHAWAIALTAGLSTAFLGIALHAMVFVVAWSMTFFWRRHIARRPTGSPFATSAPPPQVIPPVNQE